MRNDANVSQEQPVPFWKAKALSELTPAEWESLCDGCGKCCLNKLINDDDDLFFTDVACRLLDLETCQCRNYSERRKHVPDCQVLTADNILEIKWLPSTCAYRLLAEGGELPGWHPLVSGDPESVHKAGISVRGRCFSEDDVLDLENRIVEWPE